MSSVEAFWKKLKLKERATRFFSQKQRSSPPVEQKPQTQAKPDPLVQEKTTSKAAGTEIGVPVEMPESKATKGKRLDRGDIKVWEVKEPWIDVQCKLGEGPYYEEDTHMVRFTDVFGRKIYWVDLEKGPSSLRSVEVEDWVGVTADIAGINDKILVGAKYGYALMDKATGGLTYIARTYDDSKDGEGRSERMRFNDGAVDPQGRFWGGTMTDNSKYPVAVEGSLFRLDPAPPETPETPGASTPPISATCAPQLHPVEIPNGIGWTLDGKTMLFTDSPSRTIWAFDYEGESGKISNRREWFKLEGWVSIPKAGPRSEEGDCEDFEFPEGSVPDGFQLDKEGNLWTALWGAAMVIRIEDKGDERVITGVVRLPTKCTSCPRFVKGGGMVVTSASEDEEEKGPAMQGKTFWVDVGVEGAETYKFGRKVT